MKTLKEFITETTLKLKGSGSDATKNFMDDFHASTEQHPFDNRSRIFNGSSTIEVSPTGTGIHIHDIRTLAPRSGAGTEALNHLKSLSDKHKVSLHLVAKTYSRNEEHIPTTKKLHKWYKKNGFKDSPNSYGDEDNGYDMEYHPKK